MATAYLNSSRINAKLLLGLIGGSSLGYYYLNVNQPTPTLFNNNHGSNNNQGTNKWVKYSPALVFPVSKIPEGKTQKDFQEVYNAIADKVREEDDADEGAGRYGLLTRLAWHSSGTFDKAVGSGGSFGGTMVHAPESSDPANAGLQIGVEFLKEFLDKYPWISRGDLWTLGGVVAVQEAGGPTIKWRPGRENCEDLKKVPKNGYLPDASKDGAYVKNLFARMGFNERETVALIGAHALGRCHTDRSGYDGPWGPSPNMFTNDFFVRLLDGWHVKKWDGPKQYEDDEFKSFMMLPTDMALKEESYFLKYVKMYAADQDLFFKDFSAAFTKLLENGIDFQNQPYMTFKTLDDQDL